MKRYILIIAAIFAAGISGCKKDYLSLEVNPNTPSVSSPALTLSAALNASASIIVNAYPGYGVWAGYWTTSGNYVPNQTINQFQLTNQSMNGDWTAWYANLTNYNNLYVQASKDPSLANYKAIAMIMKAYGFQHLVDNYNDVPYSQAFQPSTILFPAYDKGLNIYLDLGKQLDAAIALIASSSTAQSPGPADIVFGGNMTDWAKFANSLKLRLAMRTSGVSGAAALASGLAATQTVGYLDETVDAESNPGYANVSGKQNPFYAAYGFDASGNPTGVYWRANNFAVTTLKNLNDTLRLARFYALALPVGAPASATPSVIHGNVFGDPKALSNSFTSGVGPGLLKTPTSNSVLFSGAESLFLQAEAANKGFISGTPQTLYERGITASFLALGLKATDAAAYFAQPLNNVNWVASSDKEVAIITQKWIALNGYFNNEAWNEYRRTGYPVHPSTIDPASVSTTGTYPTRILYPLSELNTNATNLGKEGAIDPFTTKIFWAK